MKVTTKGQVTIPQELRMKYGLDANSEVEFVEDDDRIVLRICRRSEARLEALRGRGDIAMGTEEILALTRGD
jgi:AbrB family looped-hinge helix DNA binding protein